MVLLARVCGLALCSLLATVSCGTGTGGGVVAVRDGDRELARLDRAALEALPQVQVSTPGVGKGVQSGPTVTTVLERAGAAPVSAVRVEGSDPPQTLTADELTDRLVLDLTARGTAKLAGADVPQSRWVRDVSALVVNP